MITNLYLENFKPFREQVSIKLAPVTLIFGPNSSGKSSIIQALLLLQQSWSDDISSIRYLQPIGEIVQLGNFQHIQHRYSEGKPSGPVCMGASFSESAWSSYLFFVNADDGERGVLKSVNLKSDRTQLEFHVTSSRDENKLELSLDKDSNSNLRNFAQPEAGDQSDLDGFYFRATLLNDSIETWVAQIRDDGTNKESIIELESSMSMEKFEEFFEKKALLFISMLSRLREAIEKGLVQFRNEILAITRVGPMRISGERLSTPWPGTETVGMDGRGMASILYENPDVTNQVNQWLQQMSTGYEVSSHSLEAPGGSTRFGRLPLRIELKDIHGRRVGVSDVGFGLSQVLPVLTELAMAAQQTAEHRKMVLLEQPELHLHPALQANLGSVFTGYWPSGELDNSIYTADVLAETHSEHLVLRLMRLVRSRRLTPDKVSLISIEPRLSSGSSGVQGLRISDDGYSFDKPWPQGFFPQREDEEFAEDNS